MGPLFDISSFIFLISAVLGMLGGVILAVYSIRNKNHNGWLASYYFSGGYAFLVAFLIYSRYISFSPWVHMYRTGYIVGFLLFPLSFLYIRYLFMQKRFKYRDMLHFFPALIYIIDFVPFYLQPAAIKIEQASRDALGINTTWNQFSQGWLGIGEFYQPARVMLMTVYWIWELVLIQKIKSVKGAEILNTENKALVQWVKGYIFFQALFFIPFYYAVLTGDQNNLYVSAHTFPAFGIAVGMIILLLNPSILYGLKGVLIKSEYLQNRSFLQSVEISPEMNTLEYNPHNELLEPHFPNADGNHSEVKHRGKQMDYFPMEKLQSINELVEKHLEMNQSYKNKGFTMRDLASELDMQPYVLSAVINQVHQTNFNDFLNRYRIQYAKKLIEQGDGKMLTLEGLSNLCGFNNRNSFTTAFKKHTGNTPSAFVKLAFTNE